MWGENSFKASTSKPAEGDLPSEGPRTDAMFFSQLALMLAYHPMARLPLVEEDGGMKTKPEACSWRDRCSHNSLVVVSVLIHRKSEPYHKQFSARGLLGFQLPRPSVLNTKKTSWTLGYTCATHEAGPRWVRAPGRKFHLLEAVRSYQPCVRAYFFSSLKTHENSCCGINARRVL